MGHGLVSKTDIFQFSLFFSLVSVREIELDWKKQREYNNVKIEREKLGSRRRRKRSREREVRKERRVVCFWCKEETLQVFIYCFVLSFFLSLFFSIYVYFIFIIISLF